jgi:YidC/Oxa1 family membrane protein insertase
MMKLYKEHGVNPFGGCLPLLMQFPVLIALFYVIRTPLAYLGFQSEKVGDITNWIPRAVSGFAETLQSSALASDLTEHALRVNGFLGLRLDCYPSQVLSGDGSAAIPTVDCGSGFVSFLPYLLMIVLMGFTTYYQQKQMQASRPGDNPQAAQMQMFARIMPVMLMLFAFNFPTGVVLYWLTTNAWTIVQQRIILKAAPIPVPGAAPKPKPKQKPAATTDPGAKPNPRQRQAPGGAKPAAGPGDQPPVTKSRPHPSSKKKKRR